MEVLEKVGAEDWVTLLRRQKWRWAEKVVNHDADRWTRKILHWIPAEGVRVVGHPKLRWIDPIQSFASSLSGSANDTDAWLYLLHLHEEAVKALPRFLEFCRSGNID